MFLFIKNLTHNKMNNFFIKTFLVKKIKEIITLLTLSQTKTFSKFHISLFKKALKFTSLVII